MDTNIVPLEQLTSIQLSDTLDGTLGIHREKNKLPLISASNDLEAIKCWLQEYSNRPTTHRNYQKDAERLLLWTIAERKKPLSSLEGDDLLAYSEFLDNPQPKEKWC